MEESKYLICNGSFYKQGDLFLSPDNRSFRYGDGCFETMKFINGRIVLEDFHFERLFSSLQVLQFSIPSHFTKTYLSGQIQLLLERNRIHDLARIRLTIYRSDGLLSNPENNDPNYVLQCWRLTDFPVYKKHGLIVDIYKEARLSADRFSSLKNNNYLPYAMAAMWSRAESKEDALLLNCYGRVAEATTSNVFVVKDDRIKTPSLGEGCIAGIVRRHLLESCRHKGISVEETTITTEELLAADEVFITNAGWYIKCVKQCGEATYQNNKSEYLYKEIIVPLLHR